MLDAGLGASTVFRPTRPGSTCAFPTCCQSLLRLAMPSGSKARISDFTKGLFRTLALNGSFSPAPDLTAGRSRTVPGAFCISKQLSSQFNAVAAGPPPFRPNGSAYVAISGTIALCTALLALPLAQASARLVQVCAKQPARHLDTTLMSERPLRSAPGLKALKHNPLGTAATLLYSLPALCVSKSALPKAGALFMTMLCRN